MRHNGNGHTTLNDLILGLEEEFLQGINWHSLLNPLFLAAGKNGGITGETNCQKNYAPGFL